jgi:hypothetical protein
MAGWGRNYGRPRTCQSRRQVGPPDSRATVTCNRLDGHRLDHQGTINLWIRGQGVERDANGYLFYRLYEWGLAAGAKPVEVKDPR